VLQVAVQLQQHLTLMPMEIDLSRGFRLGEWEVYPQRNRFVSARNRKTLESKVMGVLVHLARNEGEVVSKTDLLDQVWPNQDIADGVLTRAVFELRRALGDSAHEPRYIKNVPRLGYRLLPAPESIEKPIAGLTRSRRAHLRATSAALLAVLVSLLAYQVLVDDKRSSRIASIAVLPFTNMTGDASKSYITDGLTEEIIHVLAQQPSLLVAARTSSFALRDLDLTVADVGERLGVDSIVEGSVREERGVQRITVQLIDSKSGSHKGSVTFDIVDGDLFGAQARIAEIIIQLLAEAGANVEPVALSTAGTTSIQAYDFYLKGRAALHTRSTESLQSAKSYLQEAVRISDTFAPAHASLAQLYIVSRAYLRLDAEDARSLSEASFKRALALDPNNVEALVAAAALAADQGDFETSVVTFQRAISLQPSHALAHLWFGEVLHLLGYTSAGWDSISLALRLDPLAGSTNTVMAKSAVFFADEERLLQAARQAESLEARHAPRFMAIHEFRSGNLRNFAQELARYHDVIGIDQAATDLLVQAAEGRVDKSSLVEQLEPFGLRQNNFFARELALLGLHSDALRAMLRAPSAEGTFIDDIWIPEFEPVRAMPEFIDLVRMLGLNDYWRKHGMPDVCNHGKPEPFCHRVAEAIGT